MPVSSWYSDISGAWIPGGIPLSSVNMIRYKEFIFKNNPIKFVHLLKKSLNLQPNINKHYREETSYTKVCEWCLSSILWWLSQYDIGQDALDSDIGEVVHYVCYLESLLFSQFYSWELSKGARARVRFETDFGSFGRIIKQTY